MTKYIILKSVRNIVKHRKLLQTERWIVRKIGSRGILRASVYISPWEKNSGKKTGHLYSLLLVRWECFKAGCLYEKEGTWSKSLDLRVQTMLEARRKECLTRHLVAWVLFIKLYGHRHVLRQSREDSMFLTLSDKKCQNQSCTVIVST